MKLPDEDKLKQRVMNILAEWNQLLLKDFSGGGWARTSCDFSLVYVSTSKFHGERYVSVPTMEIFILISLIHTEMLMSPDAGLNIIYGLKLSFEDWLRTSNCV